MKALCQSAVLQAIVLVSWFVIATASDCSKKVGPCLCEGKQLPKVDLRKILTSDGGMNVSDPFKEDYYYMASFCTKVSCDDTGDAAVCQYIKGDVGATLGQVSKYDWDRNASTPDVFSITYIDGTPILDNGGELRQTRLEVKIVDKKTDSKVTFIEELVTTNSGKTTHTYRFSLTIKRQHAGSKAGVIGIVLIILLLVAILAYFIIGGIVNYTVKGATGTEIIPNYAFWKMIPLLIKDGFMFAISPCLKYAGREGSGGYQSL